MVKKVSHPGYYLPFSVGNISVKVIFSNDGQSTLLQSLVTFTLICIMHYAAFMKRYWDDIMKLFLYTKSPPMSPSV